MRMSKEESDQHKLLSGLRSGDTDAHSQLLKLYGEPLVRFLVTVCGANQADAEDTAIETLYRAIGQIDSYKEFSNSPNAFRNWLFTIARNRWRDRIRKYRRELLTDDFELMTSGSMSDADETREMVILSVREALAKLPDSQRVTLELHYEGKDLTEVANLLGEDPGKVRQWKRRGLATLKELLQADTRIQRIFAQTAE